MKIKKKPKLGVKVGRGYFLMMMENMNVGCQFNLCTVPKKIDIEYSPQTRGKLLPIPQCIADKLIHNYEQKRMWG